MDRRTFLSALAAIPLVSLGAPADAQNATIVALNTYLNNLRSATARFRQENSDGTTSTGVFYLLKPGRLRFEYDPPHRSLVIADGLTLAIFDKKTRRLPQRYSQSETPLSLLSRNDIDVTKSRFVRRIVNDGDLTKVTLYNPDMIEAGVMQMDFSRDPVVLRAFHTTDKAGLTTSIYLGELQLNQSLDRQLFDIAYNMELQKQGKL